MSMVPPVKVGGCGGLFAPVSASAVSETSAAGSNAVDGTASGAADGSDAVSGTGSGAADGSDAVGGTTAGVADGSVVVVVVRAASAGRDELGVRFAIVPLA
jgi:hypothetical protein